jgi:hypothetical protein
VAPNCPIRQLLLRGSDVEQSTCTQKYSAQKRPAVYMQPCATHTPPVQVQVACALARVNEHPKSVHLRGPRGNGGASSNSRTRGICAHRRGGVREYDANGRERPRSRHRLLVTGLCQSLEHLSCGGGAHRWVLSSSSTKSPATSARGRWPTMIGSTSLRAERFPTSRSAARPSSAPPPRELRGTVARDELRRVKMAEEGI